MGNAALLGDDTMNEETTPAIRYVEEQIDRGAHHIPEHMIGGVKRYVLRGIPPGSGMRYLLENDFMAAHGNLDDDNRAALSGWCLFLYNYVPSLCQGSPDKVQAWIDCGGSIGRLGQ